MHIFDKGSVMPVRPEIEKFLDTVGAEKETLISSIETRIESYISSQGADCLAIVEDKGYTKVTWRLTKSIEYIAVLVAFCQGKNYNGNSLDSYLTPGVIERISEEFGKYFQEYDKELSDTVVSILADDLEFMSDLLEALVENSITNSSYIQAAAGRFSVELLKETVLAEVSGELVTQLKASAAQVAQDVSSQTAMKISATAISVPMIKALAAVLSSAIAKKIMAAIAKFLASSAFKAAMVGVLKKLMIVTVATSIVKAIAVKFGIAMSGAWLVVLLPVVAAYILYEVNVFPAKLGKKVSVRVADELRGDFDRVTSSMIDVVVKQIISTGGYVLGQQMLASTDVQEAVDAAVSEAAKSLDVNPTR